ncbi:MAG: galactokinase family protein [Spirochaetota bacterium]
MRNQDSLDNRIKSRPVEAMLASLYGKSRLEEAKARLRDLAAPLAATFPESALRFYSAPGRTELGGNHTDHNRGKVLCAAVRLDALACVAPRTDRLVKIRSLGFPNEIVVDLGILAAQSSERGTTAALVRGVAAKLAAKNITVPGFEARIDSRVIVGSGLSSSAAIEVLLGVIMTDLSGAELSPIDIARIGQEAENEYFGKPCGLMDQSASASGGVVAIDFRDPANPILTNVDFDFRAEAYDLLVVNTGGSHADLTEDYAAMPAEMRAVARLLGATELRDIDSDDLESRGPEIRSALGDRALLRALHFVAENKRVEAMVAALAKGRFRRYLGLVRSSGDSSWRLLQNLVSGRNPAEQALCVALVLSERFLGKRGVARVHGGGFAGTIQAYVRKDISREYRRYMESWFGAGSVIELVIRSKGACRVL